LAHIGIGNEKMKKTSKATQRARPKDRKESASDRVSLELQAQKHVSVAIAGLVHIMRTTESDSLRVSAINMLLDRGYGKPPRSLDVAIWDAIPFPEIREDMTLEEKQAAYRELVKRPAPPRNGY
jgi:hypothetical protein